MARAHDLLGDVQRVVLVELDVRGAGDLDLGRVVMILVWKCSARSGSACMMHCTSTTIASTAPVRMRQFLVRKLPADGMPWRIRISLDVQQMPARLMPLAPLLLAYSISSGSCTAVTIISRERRLVAVDDDVDLVVLEDAQVDLRRPSGWACRRGCRRCRWPTWSRPSRRPARCAGR